MNAFVATNTMNTPGSLTKDCPRCGQSYGIKYIIDPGKCRDCELASSREAKRIVDAAAQGRAGDELVRKNLYAMACEGVAIPGPAGMRDSIARQSLDAHTTLMITIARGEDAAASTHLHGPDSIRSIDDARAYRLALGAAAGRFAGIEHDTLVRDGISLLEVAEIRMGIRHRNGELRREWM